MDTTLHLFRHDCCWKHDLTTKAEAASIPHGKFSHPTNHPNRQHKFHALQHSLSITHLLFLEQAPSSQKMEGQSDGKSSSSVTSKLISQPICGIKQMGNAQSDMMNYHVHDGNSPHQSLCHLKPAINLLFRTGKAPTT
jgi:hypothetical protein